MPTAAILGKEVVQCSRGRHKAALLWTLPNPSQKENSTHHAIVEAGEGTPVRDAPLVVPGARDPDAERRERVVERREHLALRQYHNPTSSASQR